MVFIPREARLITGQVYCSSLRERKMIIRLTSLGRCMPKVGPVLSVAIDSIAITILRLITQKRAGFSTIIPGLIKN